MRRSFLALSLAACAPTATPDGGLSPQPSRFLLLEVSPMIPGQPATIRVTRAPAGLSGVAYVVGGFQPGVYCPPAFSPDCLSVAGPLFVEFPVAIDAAGVGEVDFVVPASVAMSTEVSVQLLLTFADQTFASNVVTRTVEGGGADTDGDGLTDADEGALGTDPTRADSDDDRLTDAEELQLGTDPTLADSDQDYLPDGSEGLAPYFTDPLDPDSDDDGLFDGLELLGGTDPTMPDTDGDTLDDWTETYVTFTDPTRADTDGDGQGDEVDPCPFDSPDDPDGDGICSRDDLCPNGSDTEDVDGDGVFDGCDPCPFDNPDDPDRDGLCGDPLLFFVSSPTVVGGDAAATALERCQQDWAATSSDPVPPLMPWLDVGVGASRPPITEAFLREAGTLDAAWRDVTGALVFDRLGELPLTAPNRTLAGFTSSGLVWTGALDDGTPAANNCNGFSVSTVVGTAGFSGGIVSWSSADVPVCSLTGRVYCFELPDADDDGCPNGVDPDPLVPGADTDGDGRGDACDACVNAAGNDDADGDGVCDADDPCPTDSPDDPDGDGLCGASSRVFVTSTPYAVRVIGSVTGGNAICQTHATNAGLTGTWRAWLGGDPFFQPTFALASDGPYRRMDGVLVATDAGDVLDGQLAAPIEVDENGVVQDVSVWTGTEPDGQSAADSCVGFTSTGGLGQIGDSSRSDPGWTDVRSVSCGGLAHLYCFEDP